MTMPLAFRLLPAICILALLSMGTAGADGTVTEQNMTQKDYKDLNKTETSIPGQLPSEPPLEVHNFDHATDQAVRDAHGVKIIKGKDWKALSPTDRDKRLRELRKVRAAGTFFMIEIPSGNVWVIDSDTYFKLKQDKVIHRWTYDEVSKLPVSVRPTPLEGQSRRGPDHEDTHASDP